MGRVFLRKHLLATILVMLMVLNACGAFYNVNVKGYAKEKQILLDNKRIFVYTNDDAADELSSDFEKKIKKAIIKEGYVSVENKSLAEFLLFFDYRVDSVAFITPSKNDYDLKISAGEFESVSTKNAYPTINRRLQLKLFDAAYILSTKTPEPIWVGDIINMSNHSDIRDIMDALIVAGIAHLGENTKNQKSYRISFKDERIEALNSDDVGN